MGQDVNYSGTVAAAKEGAFLGISSLAVSINARKRCLFNGVVVTGRIVRIADEHWFLDRTLLNINIPNIPAVTVKGFMVTRLGKRIYNRKIKRREELKSLGRFQSASQLTGGYHAVVP